MNKYAQSIKEKFIRWVTEGTDSLGKAVYLFLIIIFDEKANKQYSPKTDQSALRHVALIYIEFVIRST